MAHAAETEVEGVWESVPDKVHASTFHLDKKTQITILHHVSQEMLST